MTVTENLVKVFLVDKQLRGLQSRLKGAESFLADQVKQLGSLDGQQKTLEQSHKTTLAKANEADGETKRLDARMAALKSQMDNAQTNKEYKAFLTEINTIKADRDRSEAAAIELMQKADEIKKQIESLGGQRGERESVKKVAEGDREKRYTEIKDRLAELEAQRKPLAEALTSDVVSLYSRLLQQRGDDAMAAVEISDFKRGEFHCGSCMIALPVDHVAGLLSSGKLTRCVSCQCILYLDEAARDAAKPQAKAAKKTAKGAKADKSDKGEKANASL
jgi:predicted  nucleic acid-binding Zn-ribbon protein